MFVSKHERVSWLEANPTMSLAVTFAELAAPEPDDEAALGSDDDACDEAGDDSGDDAAALVSDAAEVACDCPAAGLDDIGLLGAAAPDDELLPPPSTELHPANVSEARASVGTMVRLIFMASSW